MPMKVMKVDCKKCGFTFFTVYNERVEKSLCGICMPDVGSNAIKVRDWEK